MGRSCHSETGGKVHNSSGGKARVHGGATRARIVDPGTHGHPGECEVGKRKAEEIRPGNSRQPVEPHALIAGGIDADVPEIDVLDVVIPGFQFHGAGRFSVEPQVAGPLEGILVDLDPIRSEPVSYLGGAGVHEDGVQPDARSGHLVTDEVVVGLVSLSAEKADAAGPVDAFDGVVTELLVAAHRIPGVVAGGPGGQPVIPDSTNVTIFHHGVEGSLGAVHPVGEGVAETAVSDHQAVREVGGVGVVPDPGSRVGLFRPDIFQVGTGSPPAPESGVASGAPTGLGSADVEIPHFGVGSVGDEAAASLCGTGEKDFGPPHTVTLNGGTHRKREGGGDFVGTRGEVDTFAGCHGCGDAVFDGGGVVGHAISDRTVACLGVQVGRQVGGGRGDGDFGFHHVDPSLDVVPAVPAKLQQIPGLIGGGKFDPNVIEALVGLQAAIGCLGIVFVGLGVEVNPGLGRGHGNLVGVGGAGLGRDLEGDGSVLAVRHAVTNVEDIHPRGQLPLDG